MTITAGDKSRFAIESGITKAYECLGSRALGYFVIFIQGQCYGVHAPDATLLALALDEVGNRIAWRGKHAAFFATEPDAGTIANAFRDSRYAPDKEDEAFFGIYNLSDIVHDSHVAWSNCDEAFDDRSFILQFDVGDRVRLIGFRSIQDGYHHDPRTYLSDLWLEADEFYSILQQWRDDFMKAWFATPKISEAEDETEGS